MRAHFALGQSGDRHDTRRLAQLFGFGTPPQGERPQPAYLVPFLRIYVFKRLSRTPRFSWTKSQTNTSILNYDSSMSVGG